VQQEDQLTTGVEMDVPNLQGKLAVVTGASDGIGLSLAARLSRAGAEVILPVRNAAKGARVTTQSSIAARTAKINWADLQSTRDYRPMAAYGQSKLALMLFALELDRRSRAAGWGLTSTVAHPGLTLTNLQASGPNLGRTSRSPLEAIFRRLAPLGWPVQTVDGGRLPALYAATSPAAQGGHYYGPGGLGHLTGAPKEKVYRSARDEAAAGRLWDLCTGLAHVEFAVQGH
jgi:NAD(P)-dependent dehydrogenase (short-subunit alcohol dehydrogenase family)